MTNGNKQIYYNYLSENAIELNENENAKFESVRVAQQNGGDIKHTSYTICIAVNNKTKLRKRITFYYNYYNYFIIFENKIKKIEDEIKKIHINKHNVLHLFYKMFYDDFKSNNSRLLDDIVPILHFAIE